MTLLPPVLILATLLCSLVAGLLFAFAVVVMPGIRRLDDGEFLRAFQEIDRVIQGNQPLFLVVWSGSVLSVLGAAALGIRELEGAARGLLIVAASLYLVGVQLPTVAVHLPLNNRIQRLEVGTMEPLARKRARKEFEPRWNRWNVLRTWCAVMAALLLAVVLGLHARP